MDPPEYAVCMMAYRRGMIVYQCILLILCIHFHNAFVCLSIFFRHILLIDLFVRIYVVYCIIEYLFLFES